VPVVWQVDFKELMLQEEIGSGAYGKVWGWDDIRWNELLFLFYNLLFCSLPYCLCLRVGQEGSVSWHRGRSEDSAFSIEVSRRDVLQGSGPFIPFEASQYRSMYAQVLSLSFPFYLFISYCCWLC
jgi:hypothetical protein